MRAIQDVLITAPTLVSDDDKCQPDLKTDANKHDKVLPPPLRLSLYGLDGQHGPEEVRRSVATYVLPCAHCQLKKPPFVQVSRRLMPIPPASSSPPPIVNLVNTMIKVAEVEEINPVKLFIITVIRPMLARPIEIAEVKKDSSLTFRKDLKSQLKLICNGITAKDIAKLVRIVVAVPSFLLTMILVNLMLETADSEQEKNGSLETAGQALIARRLDTCRDSKRQQGGKRQKWRQRQQGSTAERQQTQTAQQNNGQKFEKKMSYGKKQKTTTQQRVTRCSKLVADEERN
ncbi:hypothetical protein OUZ56_012784 [Daphnia magna]|uniref:Uncharacterized protein n=1 Tax=Daphnia magna TaxID=35525 RepID=A0ABQ9Z559_9CRUS|nr:hypothetical protein OUZ56_012784 [Daphnia magna]